ncbi:MAG: LPP20 family lipoprotein [Bacteroidetes bacterium]|nr:LPP20 family lipoprotein [Bacteroidota bacterium]
MNKKITLVATLLVVTVGTTFAQDCDKYLNQQTKTVKTGAIIIKVLGSASDMILGTSFSKFTQNLGQLQMLDNIQYQICVKLQTVKNEFSRENLEAKQEGTLATMAALISNSGVLPTDMVSQLKAQGITVPSVDTAVISETTTPPVPILPKPTWITLPPFPCQPSATSAEGVIRARGMETSIDPQIAKSVANTIALEELASKIEVTVKSTTQYFINQTKTNLDENLQTTFNRKIDITVNQTIRGYRVVCEEYQQDEQGKKFRAFVTLEVDEAKVLKPIFENLQQVPELQSALPDFGTFQATFNNALNFVESVGMN